MAKNKSDTFEWEHEFWPKSQRIGRVASCGPSFAAALLVVRSSLVGDEWRPRRSGRGRGLRLRAARGACLSFSRFICEQEFSRSCKSSSEVAKVLSLRAGKIIPLNFYCPPICGGNWEIVEKCTERRVVCIWAQAKVKPLELGKKRNQLPFGKLVHLVAAS